MMREKRLCPAPAGQDGVGSPHTERTLSARLRGLLALAVCLCLTLALLPAPAQAAGTPEGNWADNADTTWYDNDSGNTSYVISAAAQLAGLAKLVNNGIQSFENRTITLTADIDLSERMWTPIGNKNAFFAGTFNGDGHIIKGMTITGNHEYAGFFGVARSGISIYALNLQEASIETASNQAGILIGSFQAATIYDCAVSGSVKCSFYNSQLPIYIGGLAGNASDTTLSNCSVRLTAFEVKGVTSEVNGGGIVGAGTPENCFVSADTFSVTATGNTKVNKYSLGSVGKYSYWAMPKDAEFNGGTYTECFSVTPAHIKGTDNAPISEMSLYANTTSLVTALNNWVSAQNSGNYSTWVLRDGSAPYPKIVAPPADYQDISGPLDEVTHQSATGEIETGMELEGQIQENVSLLSVTMPASIPFIIDVDGKGAFKRVLSATGTLTNRSDMGVDITLTAVTDDGGLLDKVDLSLIPDPAPKDATQLALTAGTGKNDLLATLGAPEEGATSIATLKVDGADKSGGSPIGTDGDAFVVGLTLKVSKRT